MKEKKGIPVVRVKLVDGGRIGGQDIVRCPHDAMLLMAEELADNDREVLYAMNLDAGGHVLHIHQIGIGTADNCDTCGREVFKAAILANATAIILIHNHPGHTPEPSDEDIEMTMNMMILGRYLGITVEDHIIVAAGNPKKLCSIRKLIKEKAKEFSY